MDDNEFEYETTPLDSDVDTVRPAEKVETVAKRTVLAGIGALASAMDEANQRFEQFVDRGEQVREEWQDKADDIRQQNAGTRSRVRGYLRDAMDTFLNSFNMPSKGDIDTINVKLNILSRKLDELNMTHVHQEMVVPPSEPTTPSPPPPEGDLST